MPSTLDRSVIDEFASEIDEELIGLRRDIHQHPELAGDESRTSALVAERLRTAGLAVATGVGGYGVVAVLDGVSDGPTVAYRADMDAVNDDERADCAFASQVPGRRTSAATTCTPRSDWVSPWSSRGCASN